MYIAVIFVVICNSKYMDQLHVAVDSPLHACVQAKDISINL